jgi:hypothetical protein
VSDLVRQAHGCPDRATGQPVGAALADPDDVYAHVDAAVVVAPA